MQFHINRKKWMLFGGICLIFFLILGVSSFPIKSFAFTPTTGTIATSSGVRVNVRTGPSTSTAKVCQLDCGMPVNVVDATTPGDGYTWYNIQFNYNNAAKSGWVREDCISVAAASGGDTSAYYTALKAKGFPDSYCSKLAVLQAQYPNWNFVPVNTGVDFNTAVSEESVLGRNLVQSSSNDARKSMDTGAYDWTTNKWYGYDGAGWVCASSDFIAYCMDPRNFLDATNIFQFESLTYQPYQSVAGTQNILSNTFMAGNYVDADSAARNYPTDFVSIGQSLGVSPYHLAARCRQEQGTQGTSQLISGTYPGYEGYYNYFNVGAYTTSTASSTVNGLIYAKKAGWNTRYKAIQGGSQILYNRYVAIGQNTLYFQKFNVVYKPSLYTHQYMTNVQAAISEGASMSTAYADKSQAFVFYIPIYNNMPEAAAAFVDSGNGNNWLSALSVDGYNLTPSFSGNNANYSLIVGQNVGSVNISASPVAKTSTVSGTGVHNLNYGTNRIDIICKAQNGLAKTYTITIVKEQPPTSQIQINGSASIQTHYSIKDVMTGITVGSTAADVVSQISANNCSVKILKADGSENTGTVGTGNVLTVYQNNTVIASYAIVVYGDLNGDGKISNSDMVLMKKHILNVSALSGNYLTAADINKAGDGVTNKDLVLLKKHILNVQAISQ